MSRRRHNRMVRPDTLQAADAPGLEIPEDDLEPVEERGAEPDVPPASEDVLAKARALRPAEGHWLAAWEAGRNAAVEAASRGVAAEDVATIKPPDTAQCADCWTKGRDAVVSLLVWGV